MCHDVEGGKKASVADVCEIKRHLTLSNRDEMVERF